MTCPYCDFRFQMLLANNPNIPTLTPILCENCAEVSLLDGDAPRKATDDELTALKRSSAWRDMIGPAKQLIANRKRAEMARWN